MSEETLDSLAPEGELFRLYDIDQLESDLTLPRTRAEHIAWPVAVWMGGIMAMREAAG